MVYNSTKEVKEMVDTGNLIEAAVGGVIAIKLVETIDKKTKSKKTSKTSLKLASMNKLKL
jgi:hypothetical protein